MSAKKMIKTQIWTQIHAAVLADFDIALPCKAGEECKKLVDELASVIEESKLLELKLPDDVKISGGTNKTGTSVRTLAFRIRAFDEAKGHVKSLDVAAVRRALSEVCNG